MLQAALFVLPVLLVLYALAPSLWLSAAAFLAVGAGYIAVLAGLNTVVQLRAPAEARGRVLSIYMMVLGIVYPIGAVVQGGIANHTGVRAVTVAGAVVLMAAMVAIAAFRPVVFASLGDSVGPRSSPVGVPDRGAPVSDPVTVEVADRGGGRGGPTPGGRGPASPPASVRATASPSAFRPRRPCSAQCSEPSGSAWCRCCSTPPCSRPSGTC